MTTRSKQRKRGVWLAIAALPQFVCGPVALPAALALASGRVAVAQPTQPTIEASIESYLDAITASIGTSLANSSLEFGELFFGLANPAAGAYDVSMIQFDTSNQSTSTLGTGIYDEFVAFETHDDHGVFHDNGDGTGPVIVNLTHYYTAGVVDLGATSCVAVFHRVHMDAFVVMQGQSVIVEFMVPIAIPSASTGGTQASLLEEAAWLAETRANGMSRPWLTPAPMVVDGSTTDIPAPGTSPCLDPANELPQECCDCYVAEGAEGSGMTSCRIDKRDEKALCFLTAGGIYGSTAKVCSGICAGSGGILCPGCVIGGIALGTITLVLCHQLADWRYRECIENERKDLDLCLMAARCPTSPPHYPYRGAP